MNGSVQITLQNPISMLEKEKEIRIQGYLPIKAQYTCSFPRSPKLAAPGQLSLPSLNSHRHCSQSQSEALPKVNVLTHGVLTHGVSVPVPQEEEQVLRVGHILLQHALQHHCDSAHLHNNTLEPTASSANGPGMH